MKTRISLIAGLLLANMSYGQCFDERRLDFQEKDSTVYMRIVEYISDAAQNNSGVELYKMGIYRIVNYTDKEGRRCMWLKLWIDDRYKDISQPSKYGYFFFNKLLLFYEGDSEGKIIEQPYNAEFAKCLDIIVGDRVYLRPPKQKRYAPLITEGGKVKIVEDDRKVEVLGNDSFERVYIFEKDGRVTVYTPA